MDLPTSSLSSFSTAVPSWHLLIDKVIVCVLGDTGPDAAVERYYFKIV